MKWISFGLLIGLISISSCKKEAGVGGKATLKGSLTAMYYCDDSGLLVETGLIANERVYISYGSNSTFDDDTRTSATGEYAFNYLNPGSYTITVFTECSNCPSGSTAMSQSIEIGKKDKNVDFPALTIDKYSGRGCPIDSTVGFATATGILEMIYIDENNLDTIKVETVANERVFIAKKGENTHFDDVRSSSDGTYRFLELPIGEYSVYAYSDCSDPIITCPSGKEAKYQIFSVTEKYQKVTIPVFRVVSYK